MSARGVQYTARVDAVIYDSATATFAREDWIRTALAALDQAGVSPEELARAYRLSRGYIEATLVELESAE